MSQEFKVGRARPWYGRKWWMRSRNVVSVQTPQGWTGAAEFYVPWWAGLLELTHRLVFGYPKLELIETQD
jgi:hypothetical protein